MIPTYIELLLQVGLDCNLLAAIAVHPEWSDSFRPNVQVTLLVLKIGETQPPVCLTMQQQIQQMVTRLAGVVDYGPHN